MVPKFDVDASSQKELELYNFYICKIVPIHVSVKYIKHEGGKKEEERESCLDSKLPSVFP